MLSIKNIVLLILFSRICIAQDIPLNEYNLPVVHDINIYLKSVESDSNNLLVDIEEFIPGIKLDIRYAGTNNFFGEPVYRMPKAYCRLPVAAALKQIQETLKKEGLELKIFDAYRPYSVTVIFFEKIKDSTFAASPWSGSRHNRGCAVDLTLVFSSTKDELRMPTEYDDFSEKAASDYTDLPDEIKKNRAKLQEVMLKYGFNLYDSEWWHYDFKDWNKYHLMDISFEQLEQLK